MKNSTPKKSSSVEKKTFKAKRSNGNGGASTSTAVVPRSPALVGSRSPQSSLRSPDERSIIVPAGYTGRVIQPAKEYDVISFARAMNPDFGPQVQKLFQPETAAVEETQQTGIYITWRCGGNKFDCQRLSSMSKCFCGHLLYEHQKWTGRSHLVLCKLCNCCGFAFIPSRPEEIGEFWHQRRRDFDPSKWRAKCRCKHTHEEHQAGKPSRSCKIKGCSCNYFNSDFLCAACDRHWEEHDTHFETELMRKEQGLPYGDDYFPFAEIPQLQRMVLTGEDDGEFTLASHKESLGLPPGADLPALPPGQASSNFPHGTSPSRSPTFEARHVSPHGGTGSHSPSLQDTTVFPKPKGF